MTPCIVYSRTYNIGFFGLERLHYFDGKKYARAWRCLRKHFGGTLREMLVKPAKPIQVDELLTVHSESYLKQLRDSKYLAAALEVSLLHYMPHRLIDWCVLRPMRWATAGTITAAKEAMRCGFAVNLGGGFHHAKPDAGEGFCIYSDIALAVHALRDEGLLSDEDRVAYIDLDAHQGNGVCHAFVNDHRVFIFDMYNATIYPWYDLRAQDRIDCKVALDETCSDSEYLHQLKSRLPPFLDSVSKSQSVGLAIYNAGTDVFQDDLLGRLNVTASGILERDLFVVEELRQRNIPTVFLLSGGYTRISYRLTADSLIKILERYRTM